MLENAPLIILRHLTNIVEDLSKWDTVGYGVQDSTHWYDFMNKVKFLLGLPSGANRIMKRLMRESVYIGNNIIKSLYNIIEVN